jgi:phosphoribosyl-AMP cyclohydrolase
MGTAPCNGAPVRGPFRGQFDRPLTMTLFRQLEHAPQHQRAPLADVLAAIRFDANGLIPAIAQQYDSGAVLMLAWMNRAALEETLATGRVCYFSRSRQRLWRKGEESGHVQMLRELRIDCDGDALLLCVEQTGPACHTNRTSCFYLRVDGDSVLVIDTAR